MDRLAEHIVAWHNRHPLARRIAVRDVHTVGVVALPFVRAPERVVGVVEPVLTDAVSFDDLELGAAKRRGAGWQRRLREWVGKLGWPVRTRWRAFNERFLPGLSPAQVERFALAHGFSEPPAAPEAKPWRIVVIDEARARAHSGWPFELYLMSAAVDVGSSRTRVLTGRGIPSEVVGRRLLDPRRLALLAGALTLLAAAAAGLVWRGGAGSTADTADLAASAASAPASGPTPAHAASEPASGGGAGTGAGLGAGLGAVMDGAASAPTGQATPADAAASAPGTAGSAPASTVAAEAAPDDAAEPASAPDIRPRLVQLTGRPSDTPRPPLRRSEPTPAAAAPTAAPNAADTSNATATAPPNSTAKATATAMRDGRGAGSDASPAATDRKPADPKLARLAQSAPKTVVALVGPPGSKAEAEALLKKMEAALLGQAPGSLQAQVIETPEGWRATVWPFTSREQAALINAILVARGMKTRAVDF